MSSPFPHPSPWHYQQESGQCLYCLGSSPFILWLFHSSSALSFSKSLFPSFPVPLFLILVAFYNWTPLSSSKSPSFPVSVLVFPLLLPLYIPSSLPFSLIPSSFSIIPFPLDVLFPVLPSASPSYIFLIFTVTNYKFLWIIFDISYPFLLFLFVFCV